MTAADFFGLNLAWTRLQVSSMVLQLLFVMIGSCRRNLLMIPCNHPEVAVQIPSIARIMEHETAIQARHQSLEGV